MCGVPANLENAYFMPSRGHYGDTIIYRCMEGYRLSTKDDNFEVNCTGTGTWSPSNLPICLGRFNQYLCHIYVLFNILMLLYMWGLRFCK